MVSSFIRILVAAVIASAMAVAAQAQDLATQCLQSNPFHHTQKTIWLCGLALDIPNTQRDLRAKLLAARGEAFHWVPDPQNAVAAFNAALALDQTLTDARIFKGWSLVRVGDHEAAQTTFEQAEKMDGSSARAVYALGWMAVHFEHGSDPETLFTEALRRQPGFLLAHLALADFYRDQRGDFEKALEHLDAILNTSEATVNETRFFGTAAFKTKDFYAYALFNKATLLRHMHRDGEANDILGRLISDHPEALGPRSELAMNFNAARKFQAALDTANACLGTAPSYFDCLREKLISQVNLNLNLDAIKTGKLLLWYETSLNSDTLASGCFYDAMAMKALGNRQAAHNLFICAFNAEPFYLSAGITQLMQAGYYQGQTSDPMSPEIDVALRACVADPKCMVIQ